MKLVCFLLVAGAVGGKAVVKVICEGLQVHSSTVAPIDADC
jgi:hypothetical protein